MQAVILAGGEGTRLRPLTYDTPKSMLRIADKPFLEHTIRLLKLNSVDDLVICVAYRGEAIRDYFGDGQSFGVRIRYSEDGSRLAGTAGSLREARDLLSDRFFITFGDSYPILDYQAAWNAFLQTGKKALMVVCRNFDRYGKSNTVVADGLVTFYSKKERPSGMDYIEFGVTFMDKRVTQMIPANYPVDLEVLYRRLIAEKEIAALEVQQRIYDIGSQEGLNEFRRLVDTGQLEL